MPVLMSTLTWAQTFRMCLSFQLRAMYTIKRDQSQVLRVITYTVWFIHSMMNLISCPWLYSQRILSSAVQPAYIFLGCTASVYCPRLDSQRILSSAVQPEYIVIGCTTSVYCLRLDSQRILYSSVQLAYIILGSTGSVYYPRLYS